MSDQQRKIVGEIVEGLTSSAVSAKCAVRIKGLAIHSNQIRADWGFVCSYSGKGEAPVEYAEMAASAGATVFFVDESVERYYRERLQKSAVIVPIKKINTQMTEMANRFYGKDPLAWCGVTGTNGKSSVAHLLAQSLNFCGIKSAVVGTVYCGIPGDGKSSDGMTTPDVFELRRLGIRFARSGVRVGVIECSSHGLDQNRLDGLNIVDGIFTNLSPDHRDYHCNLEHYANAKKKMFKRKGLQNAVFNMDDSYGREWLEEFRTQKTCLGYSLSEKSAGLFATSLSSGIEGTRACVRTSQEKGVLHTSLPTKWAITNKMAVLGLLQLKGFDFAQAMEALNAASELTGRMQRLKSDGVHYFVDYAHTPGALEETLKDLRALCKGRLWVLFGCGGGRDKIKRAEMGEQAARYADSVVLTNDNPRNENPSAILSDIINGMPSAHRRNHLVVEANRRQALQIVADQARKLDVVLVAGKGHEAYQEILGSKKRFDDYKLLEEMMHARSS